jgi:hypothetical protein
MAASSRKLACQHAIENVVTKERPAKESNRKMKTKMKKKSQRSA